MNFSCKTLFYHCLRDNRNTGLPVLFPNLLKFFCYVATEVRRIGQLSGFLNLFCFSIEKFYHNTVVSRNLTISQSTYQQNRRLQPQHQLQQSNQQQQWQQSQTLSSSAEGNGANKNSKLTAEQMRVFKLQCEYYNSLIKNYHRKFESPKRLNTTQPPPYYSRVHLTSNVSNVLPNNTVNKSQLQQKSLIETTRINTTLPASNVNVVRAPVYRPPGFDQISQPNLQIDMFRSQLNTCASNTYSHIPLADQTHMTGTTVQTTRGPVATSLVTNNLPSLEASIPVSWNFFGSSPGQNVCTNESSLSSLSRMVDKDFQSVPIDPTVTTQTTENFKIHLPLSQPHGQNVTNTSSVSTTTNCAVSNISENIPVKGEEINVLHLENKEPEAIDVDEYIQKKLLESDCIDLDDYFFDIDPVKSESEGLNQNSINKENDNNMEIPRFGSVDSGFASPPTQIKHPDVLNGERICICTKKAELMCLCGKAIYCSSNCQITDWNKHKEQCIRTRETNTV